MLLLTVARSSSYDIAIRCVLPVLWMASCLHNVADGPESKTTLPYVEFARWRQRGRRCCLWMQARCLGV